MKLNIEFRKITVRKKEREDGIHRRYFYINEEYISNEVLYYYDLLQEINPEDEAAIEKFMSKTDAPSRTLNDIIIEKIEKKKTELELRSVYTEDDNFVVFFRKDF